MLHVCIQLFSHDSMTTHLGLVGFCCFFPLFAPNATMEISIQTIYIITPLIVSFFQIKIFVCVSWRISYANTRYLHHFGPSSLPLNLFPHSFPLLLKLMPSTSIIINVTYIFILTYNPLDSITDIHVYKCLGLMALDSTAYQKTCPWGNHSSLLPHPLTPWSSSSRGGTLWEFPHPC